MPFASRRQWNYCFSARKPGWDCSKWAHETPGDQGERYRKLPLKVRKKAETQAVASPHLCTCALKGEQIRPGVTRIRGNLCNVHGRYGPCDANAPPTRTAPRSRRVAPPTPKKAGGKNASPKKGGGTRKPAKTETERAQEQAAKRQERERLRAEQQTKNRADTLRSLGIAPDGQAALEALRRGEQPDGAALARGGFVKAGLVEQAADGSYRMTAAGRALLAAADAGDRGRAGDTISGARDRTTARNDRRATAEQRKREAEARRAQPKPTPKRPSRGEEARQEPPAKAPPRIPRGGGGGASSPVASGGGGSPKGGASGGGGKKPPERAALPPALRNAAAAVLDGTATPAQVAALVRAGLAKQRKDGSVRLTARGLVATREKAETHARAALSFLVLKDAAGAYRWVSFSSNAYRDRDGEIVSTKALEDDVARADAAGQYGPLRWWHVGVPLGKGLDIGVCDFNAMHGRVLIESGTFANEPIARAVAKAARSLQVSIGFVHPPSDPDAAGVFHHIRRFERSLVPIGKAANPFTQLHVQEHLTMASLKERWDAFVGLMGGEEAAREIVQAADITQKTADDAGVAYKAETEDGAPHDGAAPPTEIILNGITYVVKAAADTEVAVAEDADGIGDMEAAVVDEAAIDEEPGEMSADEFLGQIGALIDTKLAPFAALLDMERKMAGHVQSLMAPYTAKKDADDAERAAEIATLKATLDATQQRLAALEGDQPSLFGGFRASTAASTVVTKEQAAALGAPANDDTDPFADIRKYLIGTGLTSANGV